jgi:hypothetical protein
MLHTATKKIVLLLIAADQTLSRIWSCMSDFFYLLYWLTCSNQTLGVYGQAIEGHCTKSSGLKWIKSSDIPNECPLKFNFTIILFHNSFPSFVPYQAGIFRRTGKNRFTSDNWLVQASTGHFQARMDGLSTQGKFKAGMYVLSRKLALLDICV